MDNNRMSSGAAATAALPVAPRHAGQKVVVWFLVIIAVVMVVGTLARMAVRQPPRSLPVLATVPNMTLTDTSGNTLQIRALQGKVLILDLQEAGCKGLCEERNRQMQEIQYYNESVGERITQVTIKEGPFPVDILAEQAENIRAKRTWRWFVVDPEVFAELSKAVRPDRAASDLALVDGNLQVRRRILTTRKEERRELMLDSRALLLEIAQARSAAAQ